MRHTVRLMSLALIGVAAGCRAATRVVETPRVDQDLSSGNRGYLVGAPPVAPELDPSRQLIETEIEVPSFYRPKPGRGGPVGLQELSPPEIDWQAEESAGFPASESDGAYGTYVVKKGDTLWSIAAEVFGQATQWRAIYDANRDALKSPDQLRPGMSLRIPQGGAEPAAPSGASFVK